MKPIASSISEDYDIQDRIKMFMHREYEKFKRIDSIPDQRSMDAMNVNMMGGNGTAVCVILDLDFREHIDGGNALDEYTIKRNNERNDAVHSIIMQSATIEVVTLLSNCRQCMDVSVCGNIITAVYDTYHAASIVNVANYMAKTYSVIAIVNANAWNILGIKGRVTCRIGADYGRINVSYATHVNADQRTMIYRGPALTNAIALASKPADSAKVHRVSEVFYNNIKPQDDYYFEPNLQNQFKRNGDFYDSYMSNPALNAIFKSVKEEQQQLT